MTLCGEYGTTGLTLVFSGTVLGDGHHAIRTNRKLATDVAQRHNAWATSGVLDGAYPALFWEHTCTIYKEATDRLAFADWFWKLNQHYLDKPYPLEIRADDDVVVACGDCILASDSLAEPKDLLLTAAGLVSLVFLGTVCPSVTT